MKKLLTAVTLLAACTAQADIEHIHFDKNHKFGLTVVEFTRGDKIPNKSKDLNLSTEAVITYFANENLYFKAGLVAFDRDDYSVIPKVGVTTKLTTSISPYAEGSATLKVIKKEVVNRVFNYDAGANLYLFKKGYVFAQADDFVEKDKFKYEFGAGVKVSEKALASVSYVQGLNGHSNTVKASVTYVI